MRWPYAPIPSYASIPMLLQHLCARARVRALVWAHVRQVCAVCESSQRLFQPLTIHCPLSVRSRSSLCVRTRMRVLQTDGARNHIHDICSCTGAGVAFEMQCALLRSSLLLLLCVCVCVCLYVIMCVCVCVRVCVCVCVCN